MSRTQNTRLGILMIIASCVVFSVQDMISRTLGTRVDVFMIVMVRFWVFGAFAVMMTARRPGGLSEALRTRSLLIHVLRGILLISEICFIIFAFLHLGLIETHAIFVCSPLLVVALSGPLLGEKVGWRRWLAVLVGFAGVLIILDPRQGAFTLWSLLPFAAALTFAIYSVLTRLAARQEHGGISFFWTGVIGAIVATPMGLLHWQQISAADWGLLAVLCGVAMLGHGLVIKAYSLAEASALQPFAYFQLPIVSLAGVTFFSEVLRLNTMIGASIVVGAGLFTFWRQMVRDREAASRA